MTADDRITEAHVLAAIYAGKRRKVWSPCTTLENMGIERYPHHPKENRTAMKAVLESLHARGYLHRRATTHSHYTFKEVAYERVTGLDVQPADASDAASRRR
jgi:hypothetical protein